jgi:two-component system sensor histidine kinase KdpD
LKTPLAAIIGAAGTLKDLSRDLDDNAKADLLATIIDESERLNRFIANLLDMTKLESGAIKPNIALHDLGEIVGTALQRASKILNQHRVEVELNSDLPMLELDAAGVKKVPSNFRSSMKEAASRPRMWNASSISSIARRRRIMFAQAPA